MTVQTLGRYRIEKELGRGAMGRVFLAYDTEIERRVAIKTIQAFESLPTADRAEARERFLREARAAGQLGHPGIVTIFDVSEADGVPYLAMEFIEGTTLDGYCRDGERLPVPVVLELTAHAAEALAFAHARGVIHRDIKPANLMRVGTTSVKIMDFGLAKNVASRMTHDGALFGTPNYMSPEQVRGESLDGRSDLFSLGVVLYELLTGAKPFGGDSVSSVLYRIVHEAPREADLATGALGPRLAALVERALAKSREDRFPDGLSFATALREAGAQQRTGPPRPRPRPGAPLPAPQTIERSTQRPAPARRSSRGAWIAIGLAISVAAVAAVVLATRRDAIPPPIPMLEARVRTEPPGLPVLLDGRPVEGGVVRFPETGPYGVLTLAESCRRETRQLAAGDAGSEIVLSLDAVRAEVLVDPGVPGARVSLNGAAPSPAPAAFELDLCRENKIDVEAAGFRAAGVAIPRAATPLAARTAAAAIRLESIPTGRIVLPATRLPMRFFVDGAPARRSAAGLELSSGPHEVRAENDEHFLRVITTVEVREGATIEAPIAIPPLARLQVQSFPPEARVVVGRPGDPGRRVGETPLSLDVAAGDYVVVVTDPATGTSREERIALRPGTNPPVRVSFGGRK